MRLDGRRPATKDRKRIADDIKSSASVEVARALTLIFPGTGPGGYFGRGNRVRNMDEEALGNLLIRKIARTLIREWMEAELGREFGLGRNGVKPSLQIEIKSGRPFPNISLKWNKATRGTTNRLEIEDATIRYLEERILNWGNNRSPNNNYVAGSTRALGYRAPSKTVYFDHLARNRGGPIADEAFTGRTPGEADIEAWIFLAKEHVVTPGMIFNFQNEVGQSINEPSTARLVGVGYRISVIPYAWWSPYLSG